MRQELIEKQEHTRSEIEEINEQIQRYEERLEQTEKKYEALFSKYENLQRLIALHDEKLSKLQEEQSHIEEEILVTTKLLQKKQQELEQLIEEYKKTLSYLYKYGRTSQLALIFSSSSINQMLVRAFYLEKFNAFREKQAADIRKTEKELKQTKQQLEDARAKNGKLLAQIQDEKKALAQRKEQQKKNVALLRQHREQIQTELNEFQQQKEALNQTLARLFTEEEQIREAQARRVHRLEQERKRKLANAKEIENDLQRAREIARYSQPVKPEVYMNTERLNALSKSFAQSKGSLPWPVESHVIAEHFGRHRHPVYGTVTPNLGIEIVVDPSSPIHVVHDGYVVNILPIRGYGDVIVVKHGRFMTAYGNLSKILVRKNQVLQQGDIIGLSGDKNSVMGESLFFMVREVNTNLDPEKWLAPQAISSKY
ncbi:MAG TPA: peptidoglycan DD-metalloendopeptidase family protein [Balneolaceae bacterium]|nr:peptidoglycan DD-metalloendopeptidase family protein [Balneolaceae bacterium]